MMGMDLKITYLQALFFQTTTKFSEVWANRGLFKNTLEETLKAYPNFKFYADPKEKLVTKQPLYFFENYDFSETSSAMTLVFSLFHLLFLQLFISIL